MGLFSWFWIAMVPLLALVIYPTVHQINAVKPPSQLNFHNDQCHEINSPFTQGCETIKIIGDYAYSACVGDIAQRKVWFPPLSRRDPRGNSTGHIVRIHLKSEEVSVLKFANFDPATFYPHGIDIKADSEDPTVVRIGAINHGKTGSSVELFEHRTETDELVHYETFQNEKLLPRPNSIWLLSRSEFYVTNDGKFKSLVLSSLERSLNLKFGSVVFRGENGKARIVAEGLAYPNGIVGSSDQSTVYVSSSFGHGVHVYSRKDTGSLRQTEFVSLGIQVDNVAYDEVDNSVYAAGGADHVAGVKSMLFDIPSRFANAAYKISAATDDRVFYGHQLKSELLWSGEDEFITSAIVDRQNNNIWISSFSRPQIRVCKLETAS